MENFAGYALAGTCFILMAIWHIIWIFQRYYICMEAGAKFNCSLTFPCPFFGVRVRYWPLEAYAKMFMGTLGFSIEIIGGFENGHFVSVGNAQHATVCLLFVFTGFIDFIHSKTTLPINVDYLSNVLAFTVYGFLVWCNLQGSTPLGELIHTLLTYTIFSTVAALLAEMKFPHNAWSSLIRALLVLCLGTWLWQVGSIQYHPSSRSSWDYHNHEQMMLAVTMFTWHIGFNFVLMLSVGSLVAFRYRHYRSKIGYRVKQIKRTKRKQEITYSSEHSESDIEQIYVQPEVTTSTV